LFLFELAPLIGALPYELPTWLSPRLPRVFLNERQGFEAGKFAGQKA